jgi:predicted LPLAT superfamily acyltransferase
MIRPCLLIPVYNHGHTIEATWASLKQYGLGCILVDDGSHPATASVLDRLAAKEPGIQLVRRDHNGGKGAAVLTGLTAAQRLGYTHALQIDADGQHDAGDVPAMLALSEKEPTALISGAPQYGHDIPPARRYGRYITHAWVWLETLSFDIIDSMCGFRVYPIAATTTLAEQVEIGQHMDFDIEIMVRLYWAGTPVRFMNTRVTYPEDGISHFHPWRDNLRISWMHTKLVSQMLWQLASRPFQRSAQAAHWSQYRERGSLVGIQLCLWCYRLLGRRALEYLLYPIIIWFFLFARTARHASHDYLQRVLGRPATTRESFSHFIAFGQAQIEKLSAWSGDIPRDILDFPQREHILEQARSGKGAMILTAHLGNPEMCRAFTRGLKNIHMNVLVFHRNAANINRLMQTHSPDISMEIIQMDNIGPDTALLLQEKIQQGEFIVIAADRTSPNAMHRISQVPFFGKLAAFPQGPFILASLLDCPVYLLFALRNGSHYTMHLERFADRLVLPRRERQARLDTLIQQYAERLEHHCRLAPLQWFNFFPFWQSPSVSGKQAP